MQRVIQSIRQTATVSTPTWVLGMALVLCFLAVGRLSGAPHEPEHASASDPIPAVAFKGAKIVVQPGTVIENGTVIVRDGLIEAVGADIEIPYDARTIDADGMIIYPGFIDAGSPRGIPEGEASGRVTGSGPDRRDIDLATQIAAATQQVNRKGIYPDYSSSRYVDVSDKDAKDWRSIGVTTVHVMPSGELLNGTTTLVALDDPDLTARRDRVLIADYAMAGGWRASGDGYPGSLMGSVAHLRQTLLDGMHYATSWEIYNRVRRGVRRPPVDPAMEAVGRLLRREIPVIFPADDIDQVYRAKNLAEEFGLNLMIDGAQEGFELVDDLRNLGAPIILRIDFPREPVLGESTSRRAFMFFLGTDQEEEEPEVDVRVPVAKGVHEERMRQWKQRLANPATLDAAGLEFVLASNGTKDGKEFLKNLRLAIENGLDANVALDALTRRPAKLFGASDQLGTVEPGKIANLAIWTGPFEEESSKVRYSMVNGHLFDLKEKKKEGRGSDKEGKPDEAADADKPDADKPDASADSDQDATEADDSDQASKTTDETDTESTAKRDDADQSDQEPDAAKGEASSEDDEQPSSRRKKQKEDEIVQLDWPVETDASRVPTTQTGGNVFIRNANVITAVGDTLPGTSILVQDGRIAAIGTDLVPPAGVTVIDGTDAWVMPGIIDCHSHMVAGGNEGTLSVTPEVRCIDNIRSDDLTVYRAAAGGVTAANVLHGSANTIGGQRIIIRMKYKANPSDLLFPNFPEGIKFALGENVIRNENRYPNTRMGVESVLRMAFDAARQYKAEWSDYNALSDEEKSRTIPPRRDLRLETLQRVLDNEILVHCHCYNAGEILMLLKTFTRYGIRELTLEHGLEAYKIAPEIASFGDHGAYLSTFADFWGYKVEAYDAVPYNVALIQAAGGVPILNSDSGERVRRLNHDAAKMVRWGGLSYEDAIRSITLNPARALHIDDQVGSIEVGKRADLALFNGHPLNTFSRVFMTLVDGEVVFERPGERGGPYPLAPKSGISASMPEINETGTYAITNAQVFPGSGLPIQGGTVVIRDGKIAAVGGSDTPVPENATVVDGSNLQVYPGFIDAASTVANSDLGLTDANESGQIKPDLQADAALKPDSPLIGLARFTGATCGVTVPTGGLIAGQSALVQYDGWNFDDLLIQPQLALEMSLPSKDLDGPRQDFRARFRRRQTEETETSRPKPEQTPYEQVMELFGDAREYDRICREAEQRGVERPALDNHLEALRPYVRKEKPIVVRVSSAADILDAIDFAKEADIRIVLKDSGTEAWKVADKIAEAGIPMLIGPITRSVSSEFEPYDTVYRLPAMLHDAGVLFAFYSDSNTMARDLPLSAGLAVGYGLPEDVAIAALTSNTAKIFGIDSQLGSLEPGKRADLIVTDRSPLQATSNVIHMFIGGRPVDIDDNMHTQLYKKYLRRVESKTDGPSQR